MMLDAHRLPLPVWLQEYYIRHVDGHPVRSDAERARLVRCLEAAVERRASNVCMISLVRRPTSMASC
jgi:hypothetical protein